jgi:hypothetical protein
VPPEARTQSSRSGTLDPPASPQVAVAGQRKWIPSGPPRPPPWIPSQPHPPPPAMDPVGPPPPPPWILQQPPRPRHRSSRGLLALRRGPCRNRSCLDPHHVPRRSHLAPAIDPVGASSPSDMDLDGASSPSAMDPVTAASTTAMDLVGATSPATTTHRARGSSTGERRRRARSSGQRPRATERDRERGKGGEKDSCLPASVRK